MSTQRRVTIYHNMLWAKYKGAIFSELHTLATQANVDVSFVQIAETDGERAALGTVDLSYHRYPYRLLFKGGFNQVPALRRATALLRDLRRFPADVVVIAGYDRPEYWLMLLACMLSGRPRAVFCDSTLHDRSRGGWRETAKRWIFARCNVVFGYGIRSKEYLMHYGVPEARIRFHCQAAALPPSYDVGAIRETYRMRPDRLPHVARFIYVGRLSAEKGLPDLLRAMSRYREAHGAAVLDLVGAGSLEPALKAEVRRLGLTGSVTFHGPKHIDDIAGMLVASDALVLPSHSEPWGLVVNEALSYGCPVVVSSICGCVPELILEGETGFSFESGNVPDLCARMSAAAALGARRTAVAERCLEVASHFTPKHAAADILAGCTSMLAEHR